MTSPRVAIIILNWNGLKDTLACLESLTRLDYPSFELAVVDNGSTDDSVARIGAAHPAVVLIEIGENLGYVGGNNAGLKHAQTIAADYALLLNNDTEVDPGFLKALVDVAESDPKVGIVGPMIYYYDQPDVIWSAGGAIDWSKGLTWMMGLNEREQGQFGTQPRPVSFVTGCALLIKMPIVEQVGLLDDRFFAYYEETEWCVRVTRAGYKILHVPSAKLWHKISPVARAASPTVHYYMTRNRLLFLKSARAGWRAWLHTLVFEYARTLFSWSVRPKWRGMRAQRNVMLKAIGDYFTGRVGRVSLR
ncbi:MAG: glycosyltransferase family 2 protein [Chloroflexi bacterium]|nr:glycosyltransferase family 2 protein [Chloroflexota bacterium]